MTYIRPKSAHNLTPVEKRELLCEYFEHYKKIAARNPQLLNQKLPRSAFDKLLNDVGELILKRSKEVFTSENPVREFIEENSLPDHLEGYLPKEFRSFCIALNSLKQWLSAEQAATDRYILGGTVKKQCRELGKECLVSGRSADECTIELHHPVRDGRPPIPLAKEVHAQIEGQLSVNRNDNDPMSVIYDLKKERNYSWVMLKLGCELLLGIAETSRSKNVQASSKTFARKASAASGLNYEQLLAWISQGELT